MSATKTKSKESTILVALEPRSYNQAIGEAIAALRPTLSVHVVDSEDLVQETAWLMPRLVLCSRKKHPIAPEETAWIEYRFPEYEPPTVLVNGQSEESPILDLNDIVSLIDRTLEQTAEAPEVDHEPASTIESLAGNLIDSLRDSSSPRLSAP